MADRRASFTSFIIEVVQAPLEEEPTKKGRNLSKMATKIAGHRLC